MGQQSSSFQEVWDQKYSPDLNGYSRVNLNNSQGNDPIIWCRKLSQGYTDSMMEYHLKAKSNEKLIEIYSKFQKRYKQPNIVSTKAFSCLQRSQVDKVTGYPLSIFYQHIIANISYMKPVPYLDSLHCYSQAFKGFQNLTNQYGYFTPTKQMFHLNENAQIKIWCNSDINKIEIQNTLIQKNINELQMVQQIIQIIGQNSQSNQLVSFMQNELNKKNKSTFTNIIKQFQQICEEYKWIVPSKIQSLLRIPKMQLFNFFKNIKQNTELQNSRMMKFKNITAPQKNEGAIKGKYKSYSIQVCQEKCLQRSQTKVKINKISVVSHNKNKLYKSTLHTKSACFLQDRTLFNKTNIHSLGSKKRQIKKQSKSNTNLLNSKSHVSSIAHEKQQQKTIIRSKTQVNLNSSVESYAILQDMIPYQKSKINNEVDQRAKYNSNQQLNKIQNVRFVYPTNFIGFYTNENSKISLQNIKYNAQINSHSHNNDKNYEENHLPQKNDKINAQAIIRSDPLKFNDKRKCNKKIVKKVQQKYQQTHQQKYQQTHQQTSNAHPKKVSNSDQKHLNSHQKHLNGKAEGVVGYFRESLADISQKSMQSQQISISGTDNNNQRIQFGYQQVQTPQNVGMDVNLDTNLWDDNIDPEVMQTLLKIRQKY